MQKKSKIFLMLLILIFSSALSYAETKGMGQITAYTGEVFVRTNGRWTQLDKVPHTLFSSDKVVTNRGRAQVRFFDGDTIKLGVDSNISMNEGNGGGSKSILRQINLLIGKLHFAVNPKKKTKQLQFKTPTITAGIRGTTGGLEVNADGVTSGGLSSGSWETSGDYIPIPPDQITLPDVYAESDKLPPSDPEIANSDIQKGAVIAVKRTEAAVRTIADAEARIKNTDKSDLKELALAAAAKSEAFSVMTNADIYSAQEIVAEAERMGNPEDIKKANEILENILETADTAAEAAQMASQMADASLSAETSEAGQAFAYSALSFGSAAEANAYATNAGVNVAEIAVSDNDPVRMSMAEEQMNRADARAKQAEESAQNANDSAKEAANANSVLKAKAAADAAMEAAAQAIAHTEVAKTAADASKALSMKDIDSESEIQLQSNKEEIDDDTKPVPVLDNEEEDTIPSLEDNDQKNASPI